MRVGATTALLVERADVDAVIYGIDPFFPGRLGICWGELVAKHVTRKARAADRVRFVKRLSPQAAETIPGEVDFLFVDGDHSLAGIRCDWETWAPRIRTGGILALHDSFPTPNSPPTLGSQAFYADVIAGDLRFEQIARQDSLAVLRRK
jgi:predicted O-methyltransferase YrrM